MDKVSAERLAHLTKGRNCDKVRVLMEQCPSLAQFQVRLYSHLDNRANAVMEMLNALSGNTQAHSVVELSLSSLFGCHYSALYKAIEAFTLAEPVQWHLMAPFLPRPQQRSFASASNACRSLLARPRILGGRSDGGA